MKKILYVTTIGTTMNFFKSLFKYLLDKGFEIDIACNTDICDVDDYFKDLNCRIYNISCTRSPLNISQNIKAIKEIRNIVKNNNYDIVHCHTPIAAMCTRIACNKLRKQGLKVIYTAHGFHFYTGAPKKNWLLYYPIEWICSFITDTLITINKEDFNRAKKYFHSKKVEYVPGVGIDVDKFIDCKVDVKAKRKELGIPEKAFLILSIGELNKNKNHQLVIKALKKLNNKNIYYMIVGDGPLHNYLISLAKDYSLSNHVKILGYRKDIAELLKISDLFIHPSYREGMPVAVMEALSSGIIVATSDIRGCSDLIKKSNMFSPLDSKELLLILNNILEHPTLYKKSLLCDIDNFSIESINELILRIYF